MNAIRTDSATTRWLALLIGLAAAGCGSSQGREAEGSEAPGAEQGSAEGFVKVVNVELRPLELTDFTTYVRLTGTVEAGDDVRVSAEASGVLERFFAEKGRRVRAGQPLAKIDDEVLTTQVVEARANASLANERYERRRRLWEEQEIGSEITYLQAKYEAEAAAARLANLEARLARTTVRAPISGVFDERFVEAGEMVAVGTPVARIVQVERLKVVGGVPERFAPDVEVGGTARISFDVFPERSFEGTIEYVGATVNESSRTFPIEILMDNPERVVKPQMVANVQVETGRLTDVVVVPQEVLLRTESGYEAFVAVETEDGLVAEARGVRLGPSFQDRVVITDGLAPGDALIVVGHQLVDPGDRLRVVGPVGA